MLRLTTSENFTLRHKASLQECDVKNRRTSSVYNECQGDNQRKRYDALKTDRIKKLDCYNAFHFVLASK